jgi:flavodoxin
MARVLVVYYSRTGTTKKVASAIAQALSADLEQIADPMPRGGILGYLKSGFDATLKRATPIAAPKLSPRPYDLVVVGSPTWNASVATPVRTYLMRERGLLGAVAFFATCGGRGGDRVVGEMAQIAGIVPAATLVLRQGDVERGRHVADVDRFAHAISAKLDELARRKGREAVAAPAHAPPPAA